jgi:hypothetical protein
VSLPARYAIGDRPCPAPRRPGARNDASVSLRIPPANCGRPPGDTVDPGISGHLVIAFGAEQSLHDRTCQGHIPADHAGATMVVQHEQVMACLVVVGRFAENGQETIVQTPDEPRDDRRAGSGLKISSCFRHHEAAS